MFLFCGQIQVKQLLSKQALFGPNRNAGVRPVLPEVPQELWVTDHKVKVSPAFSCCCVSSEMTCQRTEGSLGGMFDGINQIRWQLHQYLQAGTWDGTIMQCHLWKINNVLQIEPGRGEAQQCGPWRSGVKGIICSIHQKEKIKYREKRVNQLGFIWMPCWISSDLPHLDTCWSASKLANRGLESCFFPNDHWEH